jgi:hypothetical protein
MVTSRARGRKKKSAYRLDQVGYRRLNGARGSHGPARRGGLWVVVILAALVMVNLYVFVWNKKTSVSAIRRQAEAQGLPAELPAQPLADGAPGPAGPATPLAAPPSGARGGHLAPTPAPIAPPGVIEGKVGKGDSLGRLLKKSGLTGAEADEVIRALSGVVDFKAIRAGQPFRIERGPDGRVSRFELVMSKVQKVRAVRGAGGELTGTADNTQTRIECIDSSRYAAIKAIGERTALVEAVVDIFAFDPILIALARPASPVHT